MRLQLIICVETNEESKSDWMYINETIKFFYKIDNSRIKLSPVYMRGKGNYASSRVKKEIESKIKQFMAGSKEESKTIVLYAFDTDDFKSKPEDIVFLEEVRKYTSSKGYKLVWFCKDIEQVYLGRQIENHEKTKEAIRFVSNKKIKSLVTSKFRASKMNEGKSNIIAILDEVFEEDN